MYILFEEHQYNATQNILKLVRNYYFFRFDEEVTIGNLKFKEMFAAMKSKHFAEFGSYTSGEPLFASAEWILKERFKG